VKKSPTNSRNRNGSNKNSQQTRGLLSPGSSDSENSDTDVKGKLMKHPKPKKNFSVGSDDDDDDDDGGISIKRS
jgi:hypothetical protein